MYSFYTKNFVDAAFASKNSIDHEEISYNYMTSLQKDFSNKEFEELLIVSGFIPDLYPNDSSQETLYSKLIEALVCEWANRMGFHGQLIKQKASYEDVNIEIGNKVVVCDAKSFRLGRSQQAPNAKDFLKLEDIRKWMDRYPNAAGGLVTYPCKHEWSNSSDIYQYCSTKEAPTVMLPYKYLAFLLHYRENISSASMLELWNYNMLFPKKLEKKIAGGNKVAYWNTINNTIANIAQVDLATLNNYMQHADNLIKQCVTKHKNYVITAKENMINEIQTEITKIHDVNKLKEMLFSYRVTSETQVYDITLERITKFRE